jgi:hypothetical protein
MNRDDLCKRIAAFLSDEIDCFEAPQEMVGCNLPISYPAGDNVTVYVGLRDDIWEITDRGEGYMAVLSRYTPDLKEFTKRAQLICGSLGVVFVDGRVVSAAREESLVIQVWAVARAATRIAEAVSFYRPRKKAAALAEIVSTFTDEVAGELTTRQVESGRDVPVVGASGHRYTAALYVPQREAVIEPLLPTTPFPHVSGTYAKFGDLARANSYERYAVIDDRTGEPTADIVRLLDQVGKVVEWSDREPWLVQLVQGTLQ